MNVYDFDKTIYPNDSATDFFWFCVRRHPFALLVLPAAALTALAHLGKPGLRGAVKERIYAFLRHVPDVSAAVSAFWDEKLGKIYPWYLARRREDDVILSASPTSIWLERIFPSPSSRQEWASFPRISSFSQSADRLIIMALF